MEIQDYDYFTLLFTIGSFIFAGVGLIVAGLTLFAGYLAFRAERLHRTIQADLAEVREQQAKINNTLIVTSDLAIATLPQITFTQQIPSHVLDDVGIIDDIFDGPNGNDLWRSVAAQPRAARLAYARAVYRLGSNPTSIVALVGANTGKSGADDSVVGLLNTALEALTKSRRDPVSLHRDILVRKCQALRQANDFVAADEVAGEISDLYEEYDDTASKFLGPWCRALILMQQGTAARVPSERRSAFRNAADLLSKPFDEIFGQNVKMPQSGKEDLLAQYRQHWPEIELGSIAYYTAKALWSYRLGGSASRTEADDSQAPESVARLHRALDMSLFFYESTRCASHNDPYIACIYNLCVPLLVAVKLALPDRDLELEVFTCAFPALANLSDLKRHAFDCLDDCTDLIQDMRYGQGNGGSRFIYCESVERLDSVATFVRDVRRVRGALDKPEQLRRLIRAGT